MALLRSLLLIPQNALLGLGVAIGIGFLIGFHEFGHFLFAKFFNIHAPYFYIGFGPSLIKKKIGETTFSISAIPLGGFVMLSDEYGHPRSFRSKPFWQKFLVMSGGILFNILFAYAALSLVFMAGAPKTYNLYPFNAKPVIEKVIKDSPAEDRLQKGDTILSFDGVSVGKDLRPFLRTIGTRPEQDIELVIEREGKRRIVTVTPRVHPTLGEGTGDLGILLQIDQLPSYSLIESIKYGVAATNRLIRLTLLSIKSLIVNRNFSQLSGTVMIAAVAAQGLKQGFGLFFVILAFISIQLAMLNLLPLPILDGGQLLFHAIESFTGRPLSETVQNVIQICSWGLIILLFAYTTIGDLTKLVGPYLKNLFG